MRLAHPTYAHSTLNRSAMLLELALELVVDSVALKIEFEHGLNMELSVFHNDEK